MSLSDRAVFVVDLLSISPFYDRYLVQALQARLPQLELYATTFPYEPSYWDAAGVRRAAGLADVVARLQLKSKRARRALQLGEYAYNWAKLVRDARRQRAAVVHIQWLPLLEVSAIELAAVRKLQRAGATVVYTAHNALPHDGPAQIARRYARAYAAMDHILVHTEGERHKLVRELDVAPSKVDLVPHGPLFADLPRVPRRAARAQLGLADDAEVALFVGIIRPYKGVEELLEAAVQLFAKRPRLQLVIAGQGEPAYMATLRAKIERSGFASRVRFEDRYIAVGELPALCASADVAVLPYRSASQSGALFTVAAFDAPLVATDVGGIGECLAGRELAHLVPPRDARALGSAIAALLDAPEAERRALAARLSRWAHAENGWALAAERTLAAYERALGARGTVACRAC